MLATHTGRFPRGLTVLLRLLSCGVALLALPFAWLSGEWRYARRLSPQGIHTVDDHFRHFGEPRFVGEVRHGGDVFYELTGFAQDAPLLALPSSSPVYVYDRHGRFVTWCADPGDQPGYRRAWPKVEGARLDPQTVHQRLAW